jgi:hypothetical protein
VPLNPPANCPSLTTLYCVPSDSPPTTTICCCTGTSLQQLGSEGGTPFTAATTSTPHPRSQPLCTCDHWPRSLSQVLAGCGRMKQGKQGVCTCMHACALTTPTPTHLHSASYHVPLLTQLGTLALHQAISLSVSRCTQGHGTGVIHAMVHAAGRQPSKLLQQLLLPHVPEAAATAAVARGQAPTAPGYCCQVPQAAATAAVAC